MTFRIDYAHGTSEKYETYEAAVEAVLAVFAGGAEIGHPGDIPDGGESTLVWADAESSIDDDGRRAVARICRLHG